MTLMHNSMRTTRVARSVTTPAIAIRICKSCSTSNGPKAGRYPENVQPRQPGEHVDPRGSDVRRRGADDGGVQQPCHVRPARKAEQPGLDRARSGQELVVERGRDRADDATARRG